MDSNYFPLCSNCISSCYYLKSSNYNCNTMDSNCFPLCLSCTSSFYSLNTAKYNYTTMDSNYFPSCSNYNSVCHRLNWSRSFSTTTSLNILPAALQKRPKNSHSTCLNSPKSPTKAELYRLILPENSQDVIINTLLNTAPETLKRLISSPLSLI
jgi:hypothetical protein